MAQLESYEIPSDIQNLELHGDTSKLNDFKKIFNEARSNGASYFDAFSTLIYMEESANTKCLTAYNLRNVKIEHHVDKTFKINYDNDQNYYKAWKRGTIDAFTMNPIGMHFDATIAGQISQVESQCILLKISEGFEVLLSCHGNEAQFFDINFHINRNVYQLQHNTLKWFKEHNLFSILIDNPQLDCNVLIPSQIQKPEYEFRCVQY